MLGSCNEKKNTLSATIVFSCQRKDVQKSFGWGGGCSSHDLPYVWPSGDLVKEELGVCEATVLENHVELESSGVAGDCGVCTSCLSLLHVLLRKPAMSRQVVLHR